MPLNKPYTYRDTDNLFDPCNCDLGRPFYRNKAELHCLVDEHDNGDINFHTYHAQCGACSRRTSTHPKLFQVMIEWNKQIRLENKINGGTSNDPL